MLIRSLEYDRGLNLLGAPDMGDHLFIGRDDELEQMKIILLSDPDPSDRKVLVLGGLRVFLARRTRVARILVSTPRMV